MAALRAEIGWAAHLGLQAVMLPPPPHGMRCAHFSQAVNQALEGLTHMALWAVIPVDGSMTADGTAAAAASTGSAMEVEGAPTEGASSGAGAGAGGVDEFDGWEAWHTLRTLCGYDTLLGCVLRLGPQVRVVRLCVCMPAVSLPDVCTCGSTMMPAAFGTCRGITSSMVSVVQRCRRPLTSIQTHTSCA